MHSVASEPLLRVATDGKDENLDGMPDDWAAVYGLTNATVDTDYDGLTNLEEFQFKTNPTRPDSDNDGFSDGEEVLDGDPLDRTKAPWQHSQPVLALERHTLTFKARLGQQAPGTEIAMYENLGAGNLDLRAVTQAPWLTAFSWPTGENQGAVEVGVKQSMLTPGFHSGTVMLVPDNGSAILNAPQCIRVEVWVAPNDPQYPYAVMLPYVSK